MSLIIRRWRVPRPPPPLSRYHFNINTRSADNNAGRSSPTFRLCESPPAPAAVSPRFPPRGRAAGGGSRLTTPPPHRYLGVLSSPYITSITASFLLSPHSFPFLFRGLSPRVARGSRELSRSIRVLEGRSGVPRSAGQSRARARAVQYGE